MNMMCKGRFDLSKLSNELRLDPSQNQTSLYVGGKTIIDRVPSKLGKLKVNVSSTFKESVRVLLQGQLLPEQRKGSSHNSTGTRPAGVAGRNYPTASCRGETNYCTSARVNKSKAKWSEPEKLRMRFFLQQCI